MEGWIKLHRKIRSNPIFNNLELFRLWMICLTEATHKQRAQIIGKQVVDLEPGQFVTGRFDLHTMYNNGLKNDQQKSPKTVWRWLEGLEKADFLTIKTTNKFSIVSVKNWDFYQSIDQQNDQQVTNKRPTSDQQVTTNKNVKNDKNEENEKKERRKQVSDYPSDSPYYKMAVYFYKRICDWTDNLSEPNYQKWADEFRKIVEIDKREKHAVKDVMDWVTKHDFWQSNVLSPSKLRKQFERLLIDMEKEAKKNGSAKTGVQQGRDSKDHQPSKAVGWLPSKYNRNNVIPLSEMQR